MGASRFDRKYTTVERLAFAHVPGYQRAIRSAIYWSKEVIAFALTHAPKMLVPVQKAAKRHIERGITDPQLRAKVTPRWQIGCKRMLMSNTYYPAWHNRMSMSSQMASLRCGRTPLSPPMAAFARSTPSS